MKDKRVKRLYDKRVKQLYERATEAWRLGMIEGERTCPTAADADAPIPADDTERIELGMEPNPVDVAIEVAYRQGRAHAGRRWLTDMPTEVWALVFAEAHRP